MNTQNLLDVLHNLIDDEIANFVDESEMENFEGLQTRTFEEDCLLTNDKGIVLRLADGTKFQITIQEA